MSEMTDTLFLMLMYDVKGKKLTPKLVKDHIEHLKKLDNAGKLVVCGPFKERYGALKVLRSNSIDEARSLAEADPFIIHSISTYTLLEFRYANSSNNYLGT